jgi:probable DNA repair protein
VFSYAKRVDDHACAPSPLLAGLPLATPPAAPPTTAEAAFAARVPLARVADGKAPALAAGAALRGGAYVLGAQSDCPFQAVARYRLAAREWPTASAGLTPQERGILVHATLEAFWTDVRDHAGLMALEAGALAARVGRAFDAARAKLAPARWASLPQVVAAGEGDRVVRLVRAWLDEVERARPAFVVEATECRRPLSLAGLDFDVAFDRLDRLDDGTRAIIDYKSGRGVAPAKWFEERPQGTQLPAYALAQGQGAPEAPVSAVVFAQLRPGELRALGLAADASRWPGLAEPADLELDEVPDWPAALAHWSRALEHLAQDLREGEAAVDPRADAVCNRCHLHPVCRIAGVDPEADESNGYGGST